MYEIKAMEAMCSVTFQSDKLQGRKRLEGSIGFVTCTLSLMGTAVEQWLRCCATNLKVAGSIPAGVSGFFMDVKSIRSHCGPEVYSASNRNEYQEYFLGVNSGRCVRLTILPPYCADVT